MLRKIILTISAFALSFGLGLTAFPAQALDCAEGYTGDESCESIEGSSDDGIMPLDNENSEGVIDEPIAPSTDNGETVRPEDDEAESTDDETSEEDTAVSEPEMWTVYVSLGALGGALILVIIINMIARRKKN